jgi:phosphoribosylformylglycinamidine synthase
LTQLDLPVRHGEGKFYAKKAILEKLEVNNQIVLRYATPDGLPAQGRFPDNPNGSLRDIAGICDPTGRILGLMPHPEAYHHLTHHPDWTMHREIRKRGIRPGPPEPVLGTRLFENAVRHLLNT